MSEQRLQPSPEFNPPAPPRRPMRANGRLRYDTLLDAAERLLQAGHEPPLSIRNIARQAGVPMASVYHFLPGPAAVSAALAERHMAGLADCIGRPVPRRETLGWRHIVALLNQRAISYYLQFPFAQRLLLGADHSWAIRQSDLANNRVIATGIAALLADKFPQVDAETLHETVVVGITIGDAIFALAIAEQGGLSHAWGAEASLAVCAYLAAKLETPAMSSSPALTNR